MSFRKVPPPLHGKVLAVGAKNAAAVMLSLALAVAADGQVQPSGGPRGGGKGRYANAQEQQAQQPQQQPQPQEQPHPQERDWREWDGGVNSRLADAALVAALDVPKGSLSAVDREKISDLGRQITLFAAGLRAFYVLDPDERDTLFGLLDGTSRAIFSRSKRRLRGAEGEERDGKVPALNRAIVDSLLCDATAGDDAKELCDQMKRILALKRKLGGGEEISSFQRAMLQAEFNWLAANLHELPEP